MATRHNLFVALARDNTDHQHEDQLHKVPKETFLGRERKHVTRARMSLSNATPSIIKFMSETYSRLPKQLELDHHITVDHRLLGEGQVLKYDAKKVNGYKVQARFIHYDTQKVYVFPNLHLDNEKREGIACWHEWARVEHIIKRIQDRQHRSSDFNDMMSKYLGAPDFTVRPTNQTKALLGHGLPQQSPYVYVHGNGPKLCYEFDKQRVQVFNCRLSSREGNTIHDAKSQFWVGPMHPTTIVGENDAHTDLVFGIVLWTVVPTNNSAMDTGAVSERYVTVLEILIVPKKVAVVHVDWGMPYLENMELMHAKFRTMNGRKVLGECLMKMANLSVNKAPAMAGIHRLVRYTEFLLSKPLMNTKYEHDFISQFMPEQYGSKYVSVNGKVPKLDVMHSYMVCAGPFVWNALQMQFLIQAFKNVLFTLVAHFMVKANNGFNPVASESYANVRKLFNVDDTNLNNYEKYVQGQKCIAAYLHVHHGLFPFGYSMAKFNNYDDDYEALQGLMKLTLRMCWLLALDNNLMIQTLSIAEAQIDLSFAKFSKQSQDTFMDITKKFFTTIHDAVLDGMGVKSKLKLSEAMIALESYARNVQHKVPAVSNNGLHEVELEEYISPCLISRVKLPLTASSMRCYIDLSHLHDLFKTIFDTYNAYNPYTEDHFPKYNDKHQQIAVPFKPAEALIKERHFVLQHRHGDKDKVAKPDATNTLFSMLTVDLDCRKLQLTVMQHQHRPPRILPPSDAPIRVVYRGASGPCKAESAYSAQIANFHSLESKATNMVVNRNEGELNMKKKDVTENVTVPAKAMFVKSLLGTTVGTFTDDPQSAKDPIVSGAVDEAGNLTLTWSVPQHHVYEVRILIQKLPDKRGFNIVFHSSCDGQPSANTSIALEDSRFVHHRDNDTLPQYWRKQRREVLNTALNMLVDISKSHGTERLTVFDKAITDDKFDTLLLIRSMIKDFVLKPVKDRLLKAIYGSHLRIYFDHMYAMRVSFSDIKKKTHVVMVSRNKDSSIRTIVGFNYVDSSFVINGEKIKELPVFTNDKMQEYQTALTALQDPVFAWVDTIISNVNFTPDEEPAVDNAQVLLDGVRHKWLGSMDDGFLRLFDKHRVQVEKGYLILHRDDQTFFAINSDKDNSTYKIMQGDNDSVALLKDVSFADATVDRLTDELFTAFFQMSTSDIQYTQWNQILNHFIESIDPTHYPLVTGKVKKNYLFIQVSSGENHVNFFIHPIENRVYGFSSASSVKLEMPVDKGTTLDAVLQHVMSYFVEHFYSPLAHAGRVDDDMEESKGSKRAHEDASGVSHADDGTQAGGAAHDGAGPAQGAVAAPGAVAQAPDDSHAQHDSIVVDDKDLSLAYKNYALEQVAKLFRNYPQMKMLNHYTHSATLVLRIGDGDAKDCSMIISMPAKAGQDWTIKVLKMDIESNPLEKSTQYTIERPVDYTQSSLETLMRNIIETIKTRFLPYAKLNSSILDTTGWVSKDTAMQRVLEMRDRVFSKFQRDILVPIKSWVQEAYTKQLPFIVSQFVNSDMYSTLPTSGLEIEVTSDIRYTVTMYLSKNKAHVEVESPMLHAVNNGKNKAKFPFPRLADNPQMSNETVKNIMTLLVQHLTPFNVSINAPRPAAVIQWTPELFLQCICQPVCEYLGERFNGSPILIARLHKGMGLILWDTSQWVAGQAPENTVGDAGISQLAKDDLTTINALTMGDFYGRRQVYDLPAPNECGGLVFNLKITMEQIVLQMYAKHGIPAPPSPDQDSQAPSRAASPPPGDGSASGGLDAMAVVRGLHQYQGTVAPQDFGTASAGDASWDTMEIDTSGTVAPGAPFKLQNELMLKLNFDL